VSNSKSINRKFKIPRTQACEKRFKNVKFKRFKFVNMLRINYLGM